MPIEAAVETTLDKDPIQQVEVVDVPKETLRETLEKATDLHTKEPEAKADERARGADGKFAPKVETQVKQGIIPDKPEVVRKPAPTSWKKDYHADWDKLDPKLADYLIQRESEYAKGVSTYKTEYDQVKPLQEAMSTILPDLQAHGIQPAQWITNMANAHKQLALGTPQQKLSMFMKLAQDHQVPVQQLFQQGQDGKIYYNSQVPQYQNVQQTQPDITKLVEQKFLEVQTQNQIQQFEAKAKAENSPYPHYETVKPAMAQLLDAGIATDLESAYEAALRLPQHSEIFDQMLKTKQEAESLEKARVKKEEAERARRNQISARTSTPTGKTASGKKGIRESLEDAFDEHAGRV